MVSSTLLAAALVGLALRILSLPDEAWARWQPLPDAPLVADSGTLEGAQ